jgi:hypothetical protein
MDRKEQCDEKKVSEGEREKNVWVYGCMGVWGKESC